MVMSTLREKIKIIILVTLLAFVGLIFFEWGMQSGGGGGPQGPGAVIGEVNGREIPRDVYLQMRAQVIRNFELRTGRTAEYSDFDAIEDDTWLTLVQQNLIQEQIEKHSIGVSDAEILQTLRINPPPELQAQFLDEQGQFDPARYGQALANPSLSNINWPLVEASMRLTMPTDKIQNYVGLSARVTNQEVRDYFVARNEKVRIAFVQSAPAAVTLEEDAVSDADARVYYDANPDEFRVDEQAVVEFVRFPKTPSAADSSDVRKDLENIRQMIADGEDFADKASIWSDDGSSANGGDLGFIRRGQMVQPFEDVVFSLDPGDLSDVFETQFGYHIVKVEEKKTENDAEQVRARHILMRVEASNATLRAAGQRTNDLLDAIDQGVDFAQAASELGYEIETTVPFGRSGIIPGLGVMRSAQRFAFSNRPGAVTPEALEDSRAIYVMRLVEIREPRVQDFEEVLERARAQVSEEKRREIAREKLAAAIANSDGSLASIATALEASVDTTNAFGRADFVPGVGVRNEFVARAFTLQEGQISGLVESDRGFYVMELAERIPAQDADLVERRDELRQELLQRKRANLISAWMEQLLLDAEIIDYRSGAGVPWRPDPGLIVYGKG